MLFQFLLYSKVTQLYKYIFVCVNIYIYTHYIYTFFYILFYHSLSRRFDIASCAI